MYGLDAITTHNGWAMALAGILIVFSGLVILSATIAQFHKVLSVLDARNLMVKRLKNFQNNNGRAAAQALAPNMPTDLAASAHHFKLIVDRIGEPFSLPRLLNLAELSGLSHPHAALNSLLLAGHIVPDGNGYFLWQP